MKKVILFIFTIICCFVSYSQGYQSYYGYKFTPVGDLRVLMVFVSFDEWCEEPNRVDWPQGQLIPTWAENNKWLFKNLSDFDTVSPDNQSLSNYFYQMTKHLDLERFENVYKE